MPEMVPLAPLGVTLGALLCVACAGSPSRLPGAISQSAPILSDDGSRGGHVLDFDLAEGQIEAQSASRVDVIVRAGNSTTRPT